MPLIPVVIQQDARGQRALRIDQRSSHARERIELGIGAVSGEQGEAVERVDLTREAC